MFSCKYARHQPLGSVVVVEYQKWLQFAGRPPLRQSWNDAARNSGYILQCYAGNYLLKNCFPANHLQNNFILSCCCWISKVAPVCRKTSFAPMLLHTVSSVYSALQYKLCFAPMLKWCCYTCYTLLFRTKWKAFRSSQQRHIFSPSWIGWNDVHSPLNAMTRT